MCASWVSCAWHQLAFATPDEALDDASVDGMALHASLPLTPAGGNLLGNGIGGSGGAGGGGGNAVSGDDIIMPNLCWP